MSASDPLPNDWASQPGVIDEAHLGRMTLGDRRLEREVLQIFVRQSAMMLDRITGQDPVAAAAAAHTMIGSACGIGAGRVARAAERLERAIDAGSEQELKEAIAALKDASLEINAAIDARLVDSSSRTADCA